MRFCSHGNLTGPRALSRRRRASRNQVLSTTSLKVAGEKRREVGMTAINQAAKTEISESARVVTIISHNPVKGKIWWYGEFIEDGAIFNCLNLSTSNTISQGNWGQMGEVKEGLLVPMSAFKSPAPEDVLVFLIGIPTSLIDEVAIHISFSKPV